MIAAAGLDPERVMALLVERSQALTGADGAMVSLLDGSELVTRAGAGIAQGRLVVFLPGSPAAVQLGLDEVLIPELAHVLRMLGRASLGD